MPRIIIENDTPEAVAATAKSLFGREAVEAQGPSADAVTLNYGTLSGSVEPQDGETVSQAFGRCGDLGMEAGRALTFQNGDGSVIDGSTKVEKGASYTAVPNHDPKG